MPFDIEQNSIGFLLSRTFYTYQKYLTNLLRDYSITPEQFGVIHQLRRHPGISQKELAALHGKDQTSIGKTLDRLEKKELIIRSKDPSDRRAIKLFISPNGEDIYNTVSPMVQDLNNQLNQLLTDNKSEQLIESLNEIFNNLSSSK
ncbi:MarR family winged helix-turn-helix transcriptional regulator [Paraliobacillus sp. X-1268]|uniref:MarR family winged helix-turn-helix transcriptional regulator n=1 Tax=Paraliobacillus sp. X-1268 TaxID=2213193 RepID=UPI000E3D7866|nr:MarR family winged helix-turn-helix transcriptional regulator [Paraliobacillus sp. X-1268]